MRYIKTIISVVLCLTIGVITSIQVVAGSIIEDNCANSLSFEEIEGVPETTRSIVYEIEEERSEFSKTFMLDDGSKMVAAYDQPVHYENSSGEWEDIDNSLVKTTEKTVSTKDQTGDDTVITNKSSDKDIKFSAAAAEENLVSIEYSSYPISWGYDGIRDVDSKTENEKTSLSGNEKHTTLTNLSSETSYKNVFPSVDLNCHITSTGVKEDIVLNNSNAQNEFDITYDIRNLIAKQTSDNCITLYDGNEEIYKITAPYMTDANGDISEQITIRIIEQKDGELKVRLTADSNFIRSSDRAFPIIIDPEVTIQIHRIATFTTCQDGTPLSYPPYKLSNHHFTVIAFNSLPEITPNERIINAKLHLDTENAAAIFADENEEAIIVNAHDFSSITNYQVSYEDSVLDYDSLTYDDHEEIELDITRSMREWYNNGENLDAVVLEAFDTIDNRTLNVKGYATHNTVKPILTYVYKDYTGTESTQSYHSVNAGHNATASVSDYLGNLVLTQTLFEGTGSRLPFSASLTYNSLNKDSDIASGSPCGKGWYFSFSQCIQETTGILAEQGYNYIYKDSDGTSHYLKKETDEEEWYDEDGLGLSLSVNSDSIKLENGSVTQTYELPSAGGKILSEKDERDNTTNYNYNNGSLLSVTDPANRTTTISYSVNSDNDPIVSSIQTYDNKTISFYYNGDNTLSYIQFSDGSVSRFTYDDGLLVSAKEEKISPSLSGKTVSFDYDNVGRVVTLTEKGTDNTIGNYLEISYGNDNTTTFTDRQGKESTYTFDNTGCLISVLNANGYLDSNSSDSNGLTVVGGAESFTKNYIKESTVQNAIGNSTTSYYYKINGTKDNTTSNGGECSIDNSAPSEENGKTQMIGSTSIKVHNPVLSDNAAFYTCAVHRLSATEFQNEDVTFSAYVKTKNIQQIYAGGAVGASLRINCLDSGGNSVATADSIGLIGTEEWQRLSVSCSVPSNTANIVIYCMNRYASGTAWFDCIQFEKGNSASDFNALQNSDFIGNSDWYTDENSVISPQNGSVTIDGVSGTYDNNTSDEEPTESEAEAEVETYYVETVETEPYGSISTYDDYGNLTKTEQGMVTRSVKKTYEATEDPGLASTGASPEQDEEDPPTLGNKYIYQTVDIGRAGVIFNIVGEAQANSVPLTNERRTFGIALNIYYADDIANPEPHYQEFNAYTSHTQTASMTVYPEKSDKVIDHVAFAFVYSYNENTMTITNSMLNIALSSFSSSNSTAAEGESSGNEDEDNYIDYEVLSESVDKTQPYMESSKTYDSTGNYVVSEIDESGKEITYTYDASGNTTSVTDSDYNTYGYSYDNADRVTEISYADADNAVNTYAYNNAAGNVTSISHNGFSYTFNYDVFDNLISSKIGNVTVASSTYSSNNGNLLRTDYANGDYITYVYDDYDNIIEMAGENGTIAQFVYNKKGLISKCIDELSDTTIYYYYDFAGNVTGEYRQSDDGSLSYHVGYDSDGNTVQKTGVNGQTKVVTTGIDSEGNSFTSYDGVTVNSISDDFGRTAQVETAKDGIANSFYTEYEYKTFNASNATTNLISGISQKYGENELINYGYDYNDNGDVSSVYENGVKVTQYTYGDMNQLSWYADKNTGLYKLFEYDDAGNITSVQDYRLLYTNGWMPGGLIEEHTYSYGDNNWKDKLTKYDNQTITYDANGNPLQYRDGMSCTWVNGRTLDTVTVGGNTIQMQYDYNGMRTQKGDIRYYYDSNNNLIGMVKGTHTLLFYYDENSNPTAFTDNGTMYFYIKNLQGDIVKIVNRSGSVIVNYTYDALGKRLSVKDAADNEITDLNSFALLNPLRYRGYVYDDETGLYYLQSRYYDPTVGRFLNADTLFDTVSGTPLSTNMFAYCENNPISKVDPDGDDAWWIQDTHNVFDYGHTSLLIQEARGKWWYFYWGIELMLIYIGTCTKANLNERLRTAYYIDPACIFTKFRHYLYTGYYDNIVCLHGDFRNSLVFIKTLFSKDYRNYKTTTYNNRYNMVCYIKKINWNYRLISKNCMQMSCEALIKGTFRYNDSQYGIFLNKLKKCVIPNNAYNIFKCFNYEMDRSLQANSRNYILRKYLGYLDKYYDL